MIDHRSMWIELLQFAIGTGALTWLLRRLIDRGLDVTVANHRARLDHESAVAVERLRSELAITAHESQARASTLVSKQGEVVAEVYRRLVVAENSCASMMAPMRYSNAPTASEQASTALRSIHEFLNYFDEHRIFFTDAEAAPLEEIRAHFAEAWGRFTAFGIEGTPDDGMQQARYEEQKRAWKTISSLVPDARKRLEEQFRKLLGVVARGSQSAQTQR